MNTFRYLLTITVIFVLGACGGPPETDRLDDGASRAPAPSASNPLETPTETTDPTEIAALEAVEESAGEPTETQAAVEDTIVLAEAPPEAATAGQPNWKFDADKHFTMLTTAQGTSSPPDVIEVTEVFWYGCTHCFNFDPYIKKWSQDLPDDVNFVRLPVIWNPTNQIHARLFYTAEALGKLDEMHEAVFREMHLNKKMLSTQVEILEFFQRFDVTEEEFNNTFRSFAIESKLKRAKNLTQRYRIQSVPLLVTNGKYLTEGPEIRNFDDMLAVTAELVERERQEL